MIKSFSICAVFLCVFPLFAEERPAAESAPFSQGRFVPDISLIADFTVTGRSLPDDEWQRLTLPGSAAAGDEGGSGRGFGFRYAELALSSVVDPSLDLTAIFHLTADHFEVEEVYARSRRLPWGLGLKAGKFLSGFGRINAQHAHAWSFDEAPLAWQVFFGAEGLNEVGGQLTWLVPVPFFLQLGTEVLRGESEASFGARALEDRRTVRAPGLWTAFAKGSWDIGRLTVLAGASLARGQTRQPAADLVGETLPFAGHTVIWGGDLTLLYPIDSYRSLKLQAEWLDRRTAGQEYGTGGSCALGKRQAGGYVDLLWQFDARWRAGARLETLTKSRLLRETGTVVSSGLRWGVCCVLDFNPSEFSRLRLLLLRDHARDLDGRLIPYTQVGLSLNLAIGAHGAHPF